MSRVRSHCDCECFEATGHEAAPFVRIHLATVLLGREIVNPIPEAARNAGATITTHMARRQRHSCALLQLKTLGTHDVHNSNLQLYKYVAMCVNGLHSPPLLQMDQKRVWAVQPQPSLPRSLL